MSPTTAQDSRAAVLDGLTLLRCGRGRCAPGERCFSGARPSYLLHVVTHGRGRLELAGRPYAVSRGDVVVIPPGTTAAYEADAAETEALASLWLRFDGARAGEYLTHAGLLAPRPVCRSDCLETLRRYIGCILEAFSPACENILKRNGYLLLFFSALTAAHCRPKQGGSPAFSGSPIACDAASRSGCFNAAHPDALSHFVFRDAVSANALPRSVSSDDASGVASCVRYVAEYLSLHYRERVQIAALAAGVGVSRSYLSVSFRKAFGCSPQQFLVRRRITKAQELLRTTSLSVSGVAAAVGYGDQLAFSKLFKRSCGVSPTGYREQAAAVFPPLPPTPPRKKWRVLPIMTKGVRYRHPSDRSGRFLCINVSKRRQR